MSNQKSIDERMERPTMTDNLNKLLKWAREAGFDVAHNVNGKDVSTHQTGYVFIVNEENLQAYTALAMKERDGQEERLYKQYKAEAEFQANEVAELKAHVKRLRTFLNWLHDRMVLHAPSIEGLEALRIGKEITDLLETTPSQSLTEIKNQVREECAALCMKLALRYGVSKSTFNRNMIKCAEVIMESKE